MAWLILGLLACNRAPEGPDPVQDDTGQPNADCDGAPSAPQIVAVQAFSDRTSLIWLPSTDDCDAVLQYEVLVDGGILATTERPLAAFEGLAPGEHRVVVSATDPQGNAAASEPVAFRVSADAVVAYVDDLVPADLVGQNLVWTAADAFELDATQAASLQVGQPLYAAGQDQIIPSLWRVTGLSGDDPVRVQVETEQPENILTELSVQDLVVQPVALPEDAGTWTPDGQGNETRTVVLAEGRIFVQETRPLDTPDPGRPPAANTSDVTLELDGLATVEGDLTFPRAVPITGSWEPFGTSWVRAEPSAGATFTLTAQVLAEASLSAQTGEQELFSADWWVFPYGVPVYVESTLTGALAGSVGGQVDAGAEITATAGVSGVAEWREGEGWTHADIEPFTETTQETWLTATATANVSATLTASQTVLAGGVLGAELVAQATLGASLGAEASTEQSCPLETELTEFTVDLDTDVHVEGLLATLSVGELSLYDEEPWVLFSLPTLTLDCPSTLELDTDTACGVVTDDGVNNPFDPTSLVWSTDAAHLAISGTGAEVTLRASDAGDATLEVRGHDTHLGQVATTCLGHDLAIGLVECAPYVGDVSSGFSAVCDGCGTRSLSGSLDLSTATDSDVASLSCLTGVTGDLTIDGSDLTTLTGLEQLATVGGAFDLYGNSALVDVSALTSLTTIGDTTTLSNNDQMVDFTGLEGLESINGRLYIQLNDNLTSLDGLESLTSFRSTLSMGANDVLYDLSGLSNATLSPKGSSLFIFDNPCVVQSEAWDLHSSLGAPNGYVEVTGNGGPC